MAAPPLIPGQGGNGSSSGGVALPSTAFAPTLVPGPPFPDGGECVGSLLC